ncbi:MAG: hypothetical protein ACE5KM_06770 [Planctomycetaceae bacterium]
MSHLERRGRPYPAADRIRFAELIRIHGARGARELLNRSVSLDTLLKIAREFQIVLRKGRRPRRDVDASQSGAAADVVAEDLHSDRGASQQRVANGAAAQTGNDDDRRKDKP